jgi:sugar porter (SP) family MFS transporter
MIGAASAGGAADALGRRVTLTSAGIVFGIGALVSALAPNVGVLIAGRFLVGLAIGLSSVVAPLYISESAPPESRGGLVSLYQFAITIGILAAEGVDYALAADKSWQWMLGLAVIPSIVLILGMIVMPESPRWLFANGREQQARDVLAPSRDEAEVQSSIRDIQEALAVQEVAGPQQLLAPNVRRVLFIGVALAVLQQVTGINTVIYYGPQIFKLAGFASDSSAILATLSVGIVNVLLTIVAVVFIDRVGRKPLLYAGVGGMGLALFGLAFAFATPSLGSALGPITLASLMLYVGCFAFSLGPIVWLLISELYPLRVRGRGMAIATLANWAANFAVSLVFLGMLKQLGTPATFAVYGILCIVTIFFVKTMVPETKQLELESISSARRAPAAQTLSR